MKLKTLVVFFGSAIAGLELFGCATEGPYVPSSAYHYQQMLNGWKNKDINDLIYAWGPPSSTFTMPNTNRMYTWDNVKIGPTVTSGNGSSIYLGHGIAVGGGQSVSYTKTWDCHTTAITDASGKIIAWGLKGNNCTLAYTEDEYAELESANLQKCKSLYRNTHIFIRFLPGAKNIDGLDVGPRADGFLLGCPKNFEGSIHIGSKPWTKGFFKTTGEEDYYPIPYIEDITEAADTSSNRRASP